MTSNILKLICLYCVLLTTDSLILFCSYNLCSTEVLLEFASIANLLSETFK
jgi:hypothetical protein